MKSIIEEVEEIEKQALEFYEKFQIENMGVPNVPSKPIFNANGNYIKIWERDTETFELSAQQTTFIL